VITQANFTATVTPNSSTSGGAVTNPATMTIDYTRSNIPGKACINSEINVSKGTGSWTLPSGLTVVNDLTASTSSFADPATAAIRITTNTAGIYDLAINTGTYYDFLTVSNEPRTLPVISPATSSICVDGAVELTVSASYDNPLEYEWLVYTSSPSSPTFSSTAASFTTPAFSTAGTYQVRYRERHECCGWSRPVFATVTVNNQPVAHTLTPVPNAASVCVGSTPNATFAGASGGGGTITDEYEISTNGGSTWATYSVTSGTGAAINTASLSGQTIIVRTRRTATGNGCTETAYNQHSWQVLPDPIAPTLDEASPASGTEVCSGATLSATANPGEDGTGTCTDSYQFSVNGGSSWSSYTPGSNITASGAGTNFVQVQSRRVCDGNGCDGSGETFGTIAQWTVVTDPIAPTLNVATPASGTSVCVGAVVEATVNAGSSGTGTCSNEYRYTIDGGTNWNTYTPGDNITAVTAGTNRIQVQARRVCDGNGCDGTAETFATIAQWTVNNDPTAPTLLSSSPTSGSTICFGTTVAASLQNYSDGTGTCVNEYQYSTDGGASWDPYIAGSSILADNEGTGAIQIQTRRVCDGLACDGSGETYSTVASWNVLPQINFGTVDNTAETICYGEEPSDLTMSAAPSGGSGSFEYQWAFVNAAAGCPVGTGLSGFTEIPGATSSSYSPPALTNTRTYAVRIDPIGSPDCAVETWATNCRVITVQPNVNFGTISNTPETICFGGDPGSIAFTTAPSGGSGSFSYQWYSQDGSVSCPTGTSTTGWTAISGATGTSYDPPSGLGVTTTYAVQVNENGTPDCGPATWASNCRTITVVSDPAAPSATKSPNVAGVCEGATLTITGVTDLGGGTGTCNIEYRFNTGSGFGAWGSTVPSFAAVEGTNVIEVRKSCSGNGCDAATNSFFWTVAANPTVANAGTDQGNCVGSAFTLAANTPTVGIGSWSVVSGTASISVPTAPNSGVTGVPLATSATLRWTISSGACPPSTDDVVITNENAPSVANITSVDYTCAGSQFDLAAVVPVVGTGTWSISSGTGTIAPGALPGTADLSAIPFNSSVNVQFTVSNGPGAYCPDEVDTETVNFLTDLATAADPNVTCTPIPTGGLQYFASDNGEKLYVGLNPVNNNLGATTIELPGSDAFTSPGSYWGGLGDVPNGSYGGGAADPSRMPSSEITCPDELFLEDIIEVDVTNQPINTTPVVVMYVPKAKWDDFVTDGNTWLDAVAGRRSSYNACYSGFPAPAAAPTTSNVAVTGYHDDGRSLHTVNSVSYDATGDFYAITFTTDRFSGFVIHGAGSGDPLPVQLVSFTGEHQNGENILEWLTAAEINVSHFEVERSANGKDFQKLGAVEAAGNSTEPRAYNFVDSDLPAGGLYYRLRIVDLDNTYEYSDVVYLSTNSGVAINQYINVVPNPFTDKFEVQFYQARSGQFQVVITDMAGRPVFDLTRQGSKGLVAVPLDLSTEASGSYLIQVIREDGMRLMRQVVKSTD